MLGEGSIERMEAGKAAHTKKPPDDELNFVVLDILATHGGLDSGQLREVAGKEPYKCMYLTDKMKMAGQLAALRRRMLIVPHGVGYAITEDGMKLREFLKNKLGMKKPIPPPTHSELIRMLVELGEIFRMYPEREVRSEPYQYDVVWKRLEKGTPTKVFEVQHKGVLDSALAKLKHAYDLWSASLFLIITEPKDKDRAKILLAGSFHEIENATTLIHSEEIKEIYEYKKRFRTIEEKLR